MERWKIDEHIVEVRRRPYQRTLRLRVMTDGVLRVSCASRVPRKEIIAFLLENKNFIEGQLTEILEIRERFPPKKFLPGETLLFMGAERSVSLRPSPARTRMHFENGHLILSGDVEREHQRREAAQKFYSQCGRKYLSHRVEFWSKTMKLYPAKISFRSQSSRWGSCSAAGHISLNWRLIAAPAEIIDYVIIHELAHLKHHDHSDRFWALVGEFSPQHRLFKKWLREHQWALDFLADPKL
jgi:predicted metal-dependent hydrolase